MQGHCVRRFPCQLLGLLRLQDILKMEQAFHMGYKVKNKFFYLFPTNQKVEEEDVILHHDTWDEHWFLDNEQFEKLLCANPDLMHFSNKMFLYGMGTIICRLGCFTSTSCTTINHLGRHISIDFILFNTFHRLVKLFTIMTNLNKYTFFFICFMNLPFSTYFQCLNF